MTPEFSKTYLAAFLYDVACALVVVHLVVHVQAVPEHQV